MVDIIDPLFRAKEWDAGQLGVFCKGGRAGGVAARR